MDSGWIKLHRSMLDWEWYSDQNVCRLFIHFLIKANHKDKKWRGIVIQAGSFVSSRDTLSSETGLSVQQIRTAINKLKSTGEITSKTTNKYTIYSITYWKAYQDNNQQNNQQITNKQPTNNQQITTNKNDKNVKNDKKRERFTPPKIEDVRKYIADKCLNVDAGQWFDFYGSKNWMVGKNKMSNWKMCVNTWHRRNTNETSSRVHESAKDRRIRENSEHIMREAEAAAAALSEGADG